MTTMTNFHAVLLDECGMEFGASVRAIDYQEARDQLREMYPENRGIVQLESPEDTQRREAEIYARVSDEYDDPGLAIWDELCEQEGW